MSSRCDKGASWIILVVFVISRIPKVVVPQTHEVDHDQQRKQNNSAHSEGQYEAYVVKQGNYSCRLLANCISQIQEDLAEFTNHHYMCLHAYRSSANKSAIKAKE